MVLGLVAQLSSVAHEVVIEAGLDEGPGLLLVRGGRVAHERCMLIIITRGHVSLGRPVSDRLVRAVCSPVAPFSTPETVKVAVIARSRTRRGCGRAVRGALEVLSTLLHLMLPLSCVT